MEFGQPLRVEMVLGILKAHISQIRTFCEAPW